MGNLLDARPVDVSVLFVSYNRSDLLEISYSALKAGVDFGALRVEYIVADDASAPAEVEAIERLHFDTRIMWPHNSGLGANCNRGIAAARGEFILQIQDDCEFIGSSSAVKTCLEIMRADPQVGTIQMTSQTPGVPHEIRYLAGGAAYWVFVNDGIQHARGCGDRAYSDQPHFKRRQFALDLGGYAESVPMTAMEIAYQQKVATQSRWRVAYLPQGPSFRHIGANRSFNDSILRAKRLELLEGRPIIGPVFRRSRPHLRTLRRILRVGRPE